MKLDMLVESAAIRDLIVMDDETGVHVCTQFDMNTVLLSFSRQFLEASTNKLIVSMIEARLEDSTYAGGGWSINSSVYGLSPIEKASARIGQETGYGEITAVGFQPVKTGGYSRLRAAGCKIVNVLTRIVACGIMLLYIDL